MNKEKTKTYFIVRMYDESRNQVVDTFINEPLFEKIKSYKFGANVIAIYGLNNFLKAEVIDIKLV